MKIGFSILFILFIEISLSAQTYQAEYTLTYVRDSTDMEKKRTERAFLFIENNDKTYFCTEGYLKSDSLKQLVNQGKLSAYDVIGNTKNFHHTKYYQLFERQIPYNYFTAYERISLSYYKYKILPKFKWSLTDEKKQIVDYQCTKATTFYAGRIYTAWFTEEIPITAGPHVFCGLPGFIVEIYDETGSYNFKLKQFQKYDGYIPPKPALGDNSIETTHKKIFDIREDMRLNPLDFNSRMYGMRSLKGRIPQERVEYLLSDNNPLELSID